MIEHFIPNLINIKKNYELVTYDDSVREYFFWDPPPPKKTLRLGKN